MDKINIKALVATKPHIKAEGNVITLYGIVGSWLDEMDCKTVVDAINGIEGDITVRLNSPGGDVFDGMTIMNALKTHNGKVTVIVEGLAASAASYIAVGAADELRMMEGSMLMIHNALSIVVGNASDLRKEADLLEKISGNIASIYADRSGKSLEEIKTAMDNETWFTAQEAKDFGFKVVMEDGEAKIENFALLQTYNHVPKVFNEKSPKVSSDKRDLEYILRCNGYSRNDARAIVSKVYAADQCDAEQVDSEMLDRLSETISKRGLILKGGR
jgi:ATP-dependent Clp protease protease subunit